MTQHVCAAMTVSCDAEFATVDLIVHSPSERRGVDAFALAVLKAERQIRRLVTYLVFQFPCFSSADIHPLREALSRNTSVHFEGFERGFDTLYPRTVSELIGAQYARLRGRLNEAMDYRNKIFHGQLTSKYLSTQDLLEIVDDIRAWCDALARGAYTEFDYDGFSGDSFLKSTISDLSVRFKVQFINVDAYDQFIQLHLQRR